MPTLRPATKLDVPRITEIAREAYAPYVPRIGRKPMPMVADFAAHINRNECIVIEIDGLVEGYLIRYPEDMSIQIENIAVAESSQGKGLGRILIEDTEQFARADGKDSVTLYTNIHMIENLTFYPRLGYKEIDRRTDQGFSRVYYQKRLK